VYSGNSSHVYFFLVSTIKSFKKFRLDRTSKMGHNETFPGLISDACEQGSRTECYVSIEKQSTFPIVAMVESSISLNKKSAV